jgi:hypothetical protein
MFISHIIPSKILLIPYSIPTLFLQKPTFWLQNTCNKYTLLPDKELLIGDKWLLIADKGTHRDEDMGLQDFRRKVVNEFSREFECSLRGKQMRD